MVKSKGILKAPLAAAILQLTTDHSLGLGVDFTEGGKPENPEKNPRSTGETCNYNNSTHMRLKGILKAPSAAAIRQLTTDHSLGLGVDFSHLG